MTNEQFIDWMDALWLSDAEAARKLGVAPKAIKRFKRKGAPMHVALACSAVAYKLKPWVLRHVATDSVAPETELHPPLTPMQPSV